MRLKDSLVCGRIFLDEGVKAEELIGYKVHEGHRPVDAACDGIKLIYSH